jgi:hypothetical protein
LPPGKSGKFAFFSVYCLAVGRYLHRRHPDFTIDLFENTGGFPSMSPSLKNQPKTTAAKKKPFLARPKAG